MTAGEPLVLVDMGSTRCRVWLVQNGGCRSHVEADFGVRDVARGLPVSALRDRLDHLITEAKQQAGVAERPRFGIGSGMITSAQGLMEIPHVPAPAGVVELARRIQPCSCGDLTLFLVPGVKTAPAGTGIEAALGSDVLRGEEALCLGLLAADPASKPDAVLNLGSHWKWIFLDAEGRIAGSRTSLTGEMIHAVQSQTVLASGLPQGRPTSLDAEWLALGGREFRRSGLSRALFCVRLLEQAEQGTGEQRLAFLYGAFLEAEREAFQTGDGRSKAPNALLVGPPGLASAWRDRLSELGVHATVVSEEQRDEAYRRGLLILFEAAQRLGVVPALK